MGDAGTVSVFALRAFAAGLDAAGLDAAGLLADLGLSGPSLEDADARIPAPVAFRAFEEIAARAGDPSLALRVAEHVPLGTIGFLDYHARSSPTLGEAIRRTIRYFALVNDRMEATLEIDGDAARLVQRSRGAPVPRQVAEFQIAMIVARGRMLTGRAWPMHHVSFVHPAPADTREHERFFGAPVRFEQPVDAMQFDRAFLDHPLATADPALSSVLERYAQGLVARLPAGDSTLDDARGAIAELLRQGDASLDATAARLGTTRRTLQRKLSEQGTSHAVLVDGVRKELALYWLCNPRTTITEVAYLLGFSEPAAFHRAFKRWTNKTPAEYRRARAGRLSVPPPSGSRGSRRNQ